MKKFELVFIPGPGMGHLASTVEMANILVSRDDRLSVTVLAIKIPYDAKTAEYIHSLSMSFDGKSIRFIVLPELPLPEEIRKRLLLKAILENYKPHVKEAVTKISQAGAASPRLTGFVIDMFCTTMIDVAKEFGVPCYLFYTSSASSLAIRFHLQELHQQNNNIAEQLKNSDVELVLPSFVNPIPSKVIPGIFFDKDAAVWFHDNAKRFRSEVKGILINTFVDMESHVMKWMSSGSSSQIPQLYFVGPVLHSKDTGATGSNGTLGLLKWLDDQPPASVVFLCFGSKGSFDEDQVKEIAQALERSGVRFLWSLRRPPPKGKLEAPSDYGDNIKDVFPEGFLERTMGIGKVIGWAPQVEILAHPATGGFISHCGWNSTLESVWHGVPMATWPMYAEQQFNAFEMVVELGLAVEITLDYRKDFHAERSRVLSAEEIESGIEKLMDHSDEIRKRVKTKSEESRKSVMEGGSSFISLSQFIDDVIANTS
ncbi:anthocyanidin 3-O-glucosyltransferase 2-like [Momordica charantia]|uniref:Glycosyltransferase n=1 Tax=Momordica charantia TaxID=3673 RepID=A0A6J1CLU5_MOMCH|nr:anthocyanidin 3-O-glucosyltransferase 2-like [Momordica charantia]